MTRRDRNPKPPAGRLLAIDDEPSVRRALQRQLERAGYEVDLADGTQQALDLARDGQYAVILCDLRMPEQDGLSLIELLRPLQQEAVFLLVTAVDRLDHPVSPGGTTVYSILRKPWERDELLTAVRNAVQIWASNNRIVVPKLPEPGERAKVVVIAPEGSARAAWTDWLEREDQFSATMSASPDRALTEIRRLDARAAILAVDDLSADSLQTIRSLAAVHPEVPLIVISPQTSNSAELSKASEAGAADVLFTQSLDPWGLQRSITIALTRKRDAQRLNYLAHYDQLTGLPNRLLFNEKLAAACRRAERRQGAVFVLLLDLDRFKLVNDTLGHQAGNILLVEFGRRLVASVRDLDTVARLSGDEFAVIVEDADQRTEAELVAGRIRLKLGVPFVLQGREIVVTPSIGIAAYPEHGDDIDGLLRAADLAMYRAKATGRNTVNFYDHSLRLEAEHRLHQENELRTATKQRELELFFQPQVSVQDRTIVGAEALLRWLHPERGTISPAAFVTILEELGLIVEVGKTVLQQAAMSTADWIKSGFEGLRVSVNLSAIQFRDRRLVHTIKRVLQESGLSPERLELELTESAVMEDIDHAQSVLNELADLGVRISLDDFGTVFSSLGMLNRFPLHGLKIDQSFLRQGPSGRSIISAMVGLGHTLGLEVVAEGVETEDELVFLRELGCDLVQGFLFSPALSPRAFESLLRAQTARRT